MVTRIFQLAAYIMVRNISLRCASEHFTRYYQSVAHFVWVCEATKHPNGRSQRSMQQIMRMMSPIALKVQNVYLICSMVELERCFRTAEWHSETNALLSHSMLDHIIRIICYVGRSH